MPDDVPEVEKLTLEDFKAIDFLFITAYTTTVSGSTIYTGDFGDSGWNIRAYPGYQPTSCIYSFSGDKKNLTCS
ncbi:MAG: hypothetical protein ACI4VG_09810 [Lachnospiraceae bacterium]